MKPTLIYKQKPALMLVSLLALFPFQLPFISSKISIKHLSQQPLWGPGLYWCLFLRVIKGKSM